MKESDKGWKHSAKLQAALVAGIIVVVTWATNLHNEQIVSQVLGICEAVIIGAVVGRVSMSVCQNVVSAFQQAHDTFTPDPKDVDEPSVP